MDICKFTMWELDGLRLDERSDGLSHRARHGETSDAEHAAENGWYNA
jgi:hypothetical protein